MLVTVGFMGWAGRGRQKGGVGLGKLISKGDYFWLALFCRTMSSPLSPHRAVPVNVANTWSAFLVDRLAKKPLPTACSSTAASFLPPPADFPDL